MKLPRISLAALMLAMILMALDLAALRYIYRPDPGDIDGNNLFMSLLPMGNALAIVLFQGASRGGFRGRPFALGFVIAGSAMLVAYVLCGRFFPVTMSWLYSLPRGPFVRFCRAHLPYSWFAWKLPSGDSYFRFHAALSLLYAWPQFVAAGLGGLIASRMARPAAFVGKGLPCR